MSMIHIQLSLDPSDPMAGRVLSALAAIAAGTTQPLTVVDTVVHAAEEKKSRRSKTAEAPVEAPAPAKVEAVVVTPPKMATPPTIPQAPAAAEPAPTAEPGSLLTQAQVAALVTKAMGLVGSERVQKVFQKIGKARLRDVEATDYPKLVAALNAAVAEKQAEEGLLS